MTKYIVLFDDSIEGYCNSKDSVKETIDNMVIMYACRTLPEKTIRKDVEVYKVTKVRV